MTGRFRVALVFVFTLLTLTARAAAGAPPRVNNVELLPTGPAWVAHNPCISTSAAIARTSHVQPRLPPWHTGAPLSAALRYVTPALRGHVSLCFRGEEAWFVAPTGWHEESSDVAGDGGSVRWYESSEGEAGGWAEITEIPACVGCMLDRAQGLFPDAHLQQESFLRARIPIETLSPVPDTLTRPSHCVVDLAYGSRGLKVTGQVYWDHNNMDDGYVQIFIALPRTDVPLRKVMFASFWHGSANTRHCSQKAPPAPYAGPESPGFSAIHWPTVRYLPTTSEPHAGLVRVVARDAAGNSMPTVHAWMPKSASVRTAKWILPIPQDLRQRVTLMGGGSGSGAFWMEARPRGWMPYGVDEYVPSSTGGSAWVAPGGASNGWEVFVSDAQYGGGPHFDGSALIPDANTFFHGNHTGTTNVIKLMPSPDSLTHSDACTARITYHSHGLVVRGIAYVNGVVPRGVFATGDLHEVFIAMPAKDANLQAFLLKAFTALHVPSTHPCL